MCSLTIGDASVLCLGDLPGSLDNMAGTEWETVQGPLAEQVLPGPQKEQVGRSRHLGGSQTGLWCGNQALFLFP